MTTEPGNGFAFFRWHALHFRDRWHVFDNCRGGPAWFCCLDLWRAVNE